MVVRFVAVAGCKLCDAQMLEKSLLAAIQASGEADRAVEYVAVPLVVSVEGDARVELTCRGARRGFVMQGECWPGGVDLGLGVSVALPTFRLLFTGTKGSTLGTRRLHFGFEIKRRIAGNQKPVIYCLSFLRCGPLGIMLVGPNAVRHAASAVVPAISLVPRYCSTKTRWL